MSPLPTHVLAVTGHLWHPPVPQGPEEVRREIPWRHPSSTAAPALASLLHQVAAPATSPAASTSASPASSAGAIWVNSLPGGRELAIKTSWKQGHHRTPSPEHGAGDTRLHGSWALRRRRPGSGLWPDSQRVNTEHQPLIFSLIAPNTSPARLSLSLAPRK